MLMGWGYTHWIPYLHLEIAYGLGPSLYLYAKSLADKSYRFQKQDWLHFILPFLEFLYYRSPLFRNGAIPLSDNITTPENLIYQAIQWGSLIVLTIYLYLTFSVLTTYKNWLRNNFSNLENKKLTWLEKPIIIYLSFCLIWIPIRIIDIVFFDEALRSYYFNMGFLILSIITYWIGFKGYLTIPINTEGFLNTQNPITTFTASELQATAKALQEQMRTEKHYLDHNLSLSSLSKKTGFPQKKISKALNNCLHLSFHEFVNNYRVAAFKENIQNEKYAHLSLLGIALESGFGSKSSFNLVFKSSTGLTPQQFKKQFVQNKS